MAIAEVGVLWGVVVLGIVVFVCQSRISRTSCQHNSRWRCCSVTALRVLATASCSSLHSLTTCCHVFLGPNLRLYWERSRCGITVWASCEKPSNFGRGKERGAGSSCFGVMDEVALIFISIPSFVIVSNLGARWKMKELWHLLESLGIGSGSSRCR